MSTKKLQIIGSFGNDIVTDSTLTQSGQAADAKVTGDAINSLQANIDQVAASVEGQIEIAMDGHNHDERYYTEAEIDELIEAINQNNANSNIQLCDTVSATGILLVDNASAVEHEVEVTISSDVCTDLEGITVRLVNSSGEQFAVSAADGTVTGLRHSQDSEFLIGFSQLQEQTGYLATDFVITCKYQLDLEKVIHDYVLHVDLDGDPEGGELGSSSVMIDDTLSLVGAAADAHATGERIGALENLVGTVPVADQIEEAIVEVYVQDEAPTNAPEGAIWVDTAHDGLSNAHMPTNIYVVDIGKTDVTDVDFSIYAVGDVVLVTST